MQWWGWVVAGTLMLGAELAFIDAQFYLVFTGAAAIVVGLIAALMPDFSPPAQWAGFALLAVFSMFAFRNRVYRRLRGHLPDVPMGPAGSVLTLSAALAPGESARIEHGGSYWTVRNDSDGTIAAGGRARVVQVHGLTLLVQPDR
jgi:membrane protein implicated in regulation of membrane protease activity